MALLNDLFLRILYTQLVKLLYKLDTLVIYLTSLFSWSLYHQLQNVCFVLYMELVFF